MGRSAQEARKSHQNPRSWSPGQLQPSPPGCWELKSGPLKRTGNAFGSLSQGSSPEKVVIDNFVCVCVCEVCKCTACAYLHGCRCVPVRSVSVRVCACLHRCGCVPVKYACVCTFVCVRVCEVCKCSCVCTFAQVQVCVGEICKCTCVCTLAWMQVSM